MSFSALRNRYHLSFWRFFPSFISLLAQFGGNPCSEASCGVVTFSLCFSPSFAKTVARYRGQLSPPEVPSDFPGSSLTVELNSNPEFARSFPDLSGSSPDFPESSPDFPGGQLLSLGSLTPSPDSQKLSLSC